VPPTLLLEFAGNDAQLLKPTCASQLWNQLSIIAGWLNFRKSLIYDQLLENGWCELPRTSGSDTKCHNPRVRLGFRKEIEKNSEEREKESRIGGRDSTEIEGRKGKNRGE